MDNYPVTPGNGALQYRTFAPNLEAGEGRTIYGIAVPYNAPTRIDANLIEQFARGAFNHQLSKPQRVKVAREHMALGGELIGAASLLRDETAGLYVELRISPTRTGEETLALVRDKALSELSIAFREGRNRILPGQITERVQADLREVAVVMQGAYGEMAMAGGVRSSMQQSIDRQEFIDAELRAEFERCRIRGLPDLEDTDTKVRAIRLGLIP